MKGIDKWGIISAMSSITKIAIYSPFSTIKYPLSEHFISEPNQNRNIVVKCRAIDILNDIKVKLACRYLILTY